MLIKKVVLTIVLVLYFRFQLKGDGTDLRGIIQTVVLVLASTSLLLRCLLVDNVALQLKTTARFLQQPMCTSFKVDPFPHGFCLWLRTRTALELKFSKAAKNKG